MTDLQFYCFIWGDITMNEISVVLHQGFPTFLWPCTPSEFRQMSMYPFSNSKN